MVQPLLQTLYNVFLSSLTMYDCLIVEWIERTERIISYPMGSNPQSLQPLRTKPRQCQSFPYTYYIYIYITNIILDHLTTCNLSDDLVYYRIQITNIWLAWEYDEPCMVVTNVKCHSLLLPAQSICIVGIRPRFHSFMWIILVLRLLCHVLVTCKYKNNYIFAKVTKVLTNVSILCYYRLC